MKHFSLLVLALVLACAFPVQVAATTLTHSGAQVEITVPDGWKSNQEADVIKIAAPDDSMAVVFTVVAEEKADKAFDAIEKALEKSVGQILYDNDGKPIEEKINGMPTWEWDGATKDGKLKVYSLSIETPSGKTLVVYWFGTPESEKKYEADIKTIAQGLKPLASAAPAAPAEGGDK
ncbi:MAG: hypothetical protein HQM08_00470 [Candidatus Riflebacteria bacterium]|nr:hypothetical protein [Candidatus Riflebacteria bacterium]